METLNLKLMNNLIERARTRRPGSYKEIGAEVGLHYRRPMALALGPIAEECRRRGLPLVVALVKRKDTGMPGDGFFEQVEFRSTDRRARRRFWEEYLESVYDAWKDIPPYPEE